MKETQNKTNLEALKEKIFNDEDILDFFLVIEVFKKYDKANFEDFKYFDYDDFSSYDTILSRKDNEKEVQKIKDQFAKDFSIETIKEAILYYYKMMRHENNLLMNEIISSFYDLITIKDKEEKTKSLLTFKTQLKRNNEELSSHLFEFIMTRKNIVIDYDPEQRFVKNVMKDIEDTEKTFENISKVFFQSYKNSFHNFTQRLSFGFARHCLFDKFPEDEEEIEQVIQKYTPEENKLIEIEEEQMRQRIEEAFKGELVIEEGKQILSNAYKLRIEKEQDFPEYSTPEVQEYQDKKEIFINEEVKRIDEQLKELKQDEILKYNNLIFLLTEDEDIRSVFEIKEKNIPENQSQELSLTTLTYERITTKNKLMNKVSSFSSQIFLHGGEIKPQQKITISLEGIEDNDIEMFIHDYDPLKALEREDKKTFESLMTILRFFEENNYNLDYSGFTTTDVFHLNKGNYDRNPTPKELEETKRSIERLISPRTQFNFKKYIEEWNKNCNREESQIDLSNLKEWQHSQNFILLTTDYMKATNGKQIEVWHFIKTKNAIPIPFYSFIKTTKNFEMFPIQLDGILSSGTIQDELTNQLKMKLSTLIRIKRMDTYQRNKILAKKKNIFECFFKDTEGNILDTTTASQLLREKKIKGSYYYQINCLVSSIAFECYFDQDRPEKTEKKWKEKEEARFKDSIFKFIEEAKKMNVIDDFILYDNNGKELKKIKGSYLYQTENEQRKTSKKRKEGEKTRRGKAKQTFSKFSLIMKQDFQIKKK